MLDTLAGKKYISFVDGFSGYNQIQITLEYQDKTTLTCPWDTYAYRVLRFGICNAPATFQRAVLGIFSNLTHDCVEVFMDDFLVYGETFQEDLDNLAKVLKRCQETNLALSHEKCRMILTKGVVLGHIISQARIEVDPTKISVFSSLSPPKNQKEVRSFLGHVGYYRRFIKYFTKIFAPLFKLLVKNVNFIWEDSYQNAFEDLKLRLSETPILRGPNWTLPFHINTDASDSALGVVLGQKEEPLHYAIYFISKNLTPGKFNYTVTEKNFS